MWATGFRPDYRWLDVPVVDEKGQLRHDGGVVDSPGLYALGLPVLRRRKSTFIHGIEDDAREVVDHLARYLAVRRRLPSTRRRKPHDDEGHDLGGDDDSQHCNPPATPACNAMEHRAGGTILI